MALTHLVDTSVIKRLPRPEVRAAVSPLDTVLAVSAAPSVPALRVLNLPHEPLPPAPSKV